jgi:hypothetical protein
MAPTVTDAFDLKFDTPFALASAMVGVLPSHACVELADGQLLARFGPWQVQTSIENIDSVEVTGPYAWPKVIGPPHLSLKDLGLTFAGTASKGVCIHFRTPVRGIEPLGLIRHPSLTVTVDDPEALVRELRDRLRDKADEGVIEDPYEEVEEELERIDQESHDELESMTASELRQVAKAEGIDGASSMKKDELVEVIEEHEEEEAAAD